MGGGEWARKERWTVAFLFLIFLAIRRKEELIQHIHTHSHPRNHHMDCDIASEKAEERSETVSLLEVS